MTFLTPLQILNLNIWRIEHRLLSHGDSALIAFNDIQLHLEGV